MFDCTKTNMHLWFRFELWNLGPKSGCVQTERELQSAQTHFHCSHTRSRPKDTCIATLKLTLAALQHAFTSERYMHRDALKCTRCSCLKDTRIATLKGLATSSCTLCSRLKDTFIRDAERDSHYSHTYSRLKGILTSRTRAHVWKIHTLRCSKGLATFIFIFCAWGSLCRGNKKCAWNGCELISNKLAILFVYFGMHTPGSLAIPQSWVTEPALCFGLREKLS